MIPNKPDDWAPYIANLKEGVEGILKTFKVGDGDGHEVTKKAVITAACMITFGLERLTNAVEAQTKAQAAAIDRQTKAIEANTKAIKEHTKEAESYAFGMSPG